MKTILMFLVFLILPISVFALQNPFGKPKECPDTDKVCFHSIKVSDKVTIVFKGGCNQLEHVGIVFSKNRRILLLDDLDIISDQKLKNDEIFEETLDKTFPGSRWIDYKIYDDK